MVADHAFFDLIETIGRASAEGRATPIRVGASMRCDDYGAFGLAFKSATNLLGSFQRVERFGKVVTSIANYTVLLQDRSALMMVRKAPETRLGLTMTNELAVAAGTALCREVRHRAFAPAAIHFTHPAPPDISAYEEHFRCPIHFNAERDGLEISTEHLHAPNRLGDAKISEFFDTHLEKELAARVNDGGLAERVRIHVSQALSEGAPSLAHIASRLGMSGRTLSRRLADRGLSYQALVDEARRRLAERLLEQSEYSLAEVSFLTGFSEQSAFTRAFKRWSGQTPRSFRLQVQTRVH